MTAPMLKTSPQLSPLEQSILAALAYHDVFDYPLRVEELWRWLYVTDEADGQAVAAATPADVEQALASDRLAPFVERAGSYVSLAGRSGTVATRMERKVTNQRKWRRAYLVAGVLRLVPFVRFIGVVNSLALNNARPESDIDFFIIVKRRRLWLTRAVVTALVHAMGVRRHGASVTDKVCLSFYVSDAALNLDRLKLESVESDSYLQFWITKIVPLFDRGACWESFLKVNRWVASRIPHGFIGAPVPYHADSGFVKALRFIPEVIGYSIIGDFFEWFTKALQYRHMLRKEGSRIHAHSTDVVVSDDVLKFHEKDRREEYHRIFIQRLAGLTDAA